MFRERLSKTPAVRRPIIKFLRILMRARRATFAHAVLIVRSSDGRILTFNSPSKGACLPRREIAPRISIQTQVESWLQEFSAYQAAPSLVAIKGVPSWEGLSFIYAVRIETVCSPANEAMWLDQKTAASVLSSIDYELLVSA